MRHKIKRLAAEPYRGREEYIMSNNYFLISTPSGITFDGDFTAAVSLCLATGEEVSLLPSCYTNGDYPIRPLPTKWEGSNPVHYRLWLVRAGKGIAKNLVITPSLTYALSHADILRKILHKRVSICSIQG